MPYVTAGKKTEPTSRSITKTGAADSQSCFGGAKAHYGGIVAFSQTDFTEDLKKITGPVLVMHGDDDQIVPYADAGHCRQSC